MLYLSTLPAVNQDQERLVPQKEAAAYLGIAVGTLRDWEPKGKVTGRVEVGRYMLYPLDVLQALCGDTMYD